MDAKELQFEKVVKENKATIYSVCYMFSKDNDEVADLFQEVLINLWIGFDQFKGQSSARTWIYRVALNTCISINRKKSRIKHIPLDSNINLFEDTDNDSRQIRKLYDRIKLLRPYDRAIVMLWLENMSYEEIGEIMGISEQNVATKLYRIKEALRKMPNN